MQRDIISSPTAKGKILGRYLKIISVAISRRHEASTSTGEFLPVRKLEVVHDVL